MVFTFVNLLTSWEHFGVFDYFLPFLLIFALVYGILTATNVLSGNKGVILIISLAVALLSLRFDYVPLFFSEIFPRFGIGLAVLLVVMILAALFVPKEWLGGWAGGGLAISGLIAAVVIYKSFDFLGWNLSNYDWWDQYGSVIILGVILIVILLLITQANPFEWFKGGGGDKHLGRIREDEH